jgi:hypothetical protein
MSKSSSIIFLFIGITLGLIGGFFIGKNQKPKDLKSEYTKVYATFLGGEIRGKEVLDEVQNEITDLPKAIYDIKKKATLELATRHILEIEAKKRNIAVKDLVTFLQKEHANDELDPIALARFFKSRNIDEKKLSQKDRQDYLNLFRRQKIMKLETNYIDDLVKAANVKLSIPE